MDIGILKIFSVYHKSWLVPDVPYIVPIQAGAAVTNNRLLMEGDDDGIELSARNQSLCELTVLYNIWKNRKYLPSSYWGLCHYRRYFTRHIHWSRIKKKSIYHVPASDAGFRKVFSPALESYLLKNLHPQTLIVPIALPTLIGPGKMKATVKEHYCAEHDALGWQQLEASLAERAPDYQASFSCISEGHKLYCFNMMIAHQEVWDSYLRWLFGIILHLEENYKPPADTYQRRAPGFLAERLMTTYLYHHRNDFHILEMPVVIFGENRS